MIHGNTEGIRSSLLHEMEALYAFEIEHDEFAPVELIVSLTKFTSACNREISVYISRSGEVLDVTVGTIDHVNLKEKRLRRSLKRLSGVRCIHTHPGGSPELSDVDLKALEALRLDAIAAIGVMSGRATGIQAAFFCEGEKGAPAPEVTGVLAISFLPQREWMERILESDHLIFGADDEEDRPERALLVGIESMESLAELQSLAETAGAQVVDILLQKKDKPENATFIGKGKAEQAALLAQGKECDVVIFDDELTGSQIRNLESIIRTKIIDRTTLILDIFAQRAVSRAGKLQVEIAQLAYQFPRLVGEGITLSRLGGGIGTRGPGETKLEVGRRKIRKRLSDLQKELEELIKQRAIQRMRRERNEVPVVALVGYTNTGKSSMLNALSGSTAVAEDKLFVTLDPVVRRCSSPEGGEFLLVDTVGFIRKLPHTLVDAFRSTLEETLHADLLVIVSDASSNTMHEQRDVVSQVLQELGAGDKPTIDALNKIDNCKERPWFAGGTYTSCKTGEGMDALQSAIGRKLNEGLCTVRLLIPYANGGLLSLFHDMESVLEEEHREEGTLVIVRLEKAALDKAIAILGRDALR